MKTLNLDKIEITHLYHAGFKIKYNNRLIYIDPFKVSDDKADIILISHEHFDHFDPNSIDVLSKSETQIFGPKSLEAHNLVNFRGLASSESYDFENLKIITIPAYNIEKEHHPKEKGYLGYILELADKRLYHAGDTDKTSEMCALKNIDVAMLPIGGKYAMDEYEAAEAVKTFRPKIVIPMHYADEIIPSGDVEKFTALVGSTAKVQVL